MSTDGLAVSSLARQPLTSARRPFGAEEPERQSRPPSGAKGPGPFLHGFSLPAEDQRAVLAGAYREHSLRAATMNAETRDPATPATKEARSTKACKLPAHPVDVQIGQKIKALRRARNLSQEVLAEKIGVTFQQVQKYENGSNRVSVSKLHALAAALAVDVQALVGDLAQTGESNLQAPERMAFASTPEGARLIDDILTLSPQQRRMSFGMIAALAACARAPKEEG
jgi:transcriptional regulator with XRE-family HTH domain